jgi:porin
VKRFLGFAMAVHGLMSSQVRASSPGVDARTQAMAVAEAEVREQFTRNHLFGDWGGMRTVLWQQGLDVQLLLISDPYGNSRGGLDQGFTTYNMVSADLSVDAEKLLAWNGGRFQVGFAANFGSQLTQNVVGNTFPIQSSDVAPPGPRLTTVSYTQTLMNDRLNLRIGRLSIDSLYGEEFAGSTYFRQFTSVAFNAIPFAIFYNSPGALGYPATTWGARARYQPQGGDVYVMAGLYNADPDVGLANRHGLDFTLQGPAYGIGEVGWLRNQGAGATGLPGNLKLGAFALGGNAPVLNSATTAGGRHGFYLVADQAVSRLGAPSEGRQLGLFASLVHAPATTVSPMPLFLNGGLVATGPLAHRPRDVLALGVAYGAYSPSLPQVSELTLELSYAIALSPGFSLQPGLQWIVNPGGDTATPNSLALGVNAVLSF